MKKRTRKNVVILGAGNFGTCLAQHLANKGEAVTIWGRSQEVIDSINKHHKKNHRYLPTYQLNPTILASAQWNKELYLKADAIVLAIPTQNLREILQLLKTDDQ